MYKIGTLVKYYGTITGGNDFTGLRNNVCVVVEKGLSNDLVMLYDLELGERFQANMDMVIPLDMKGYFNIGDGDG